MPKKNMNYSKTIIYKIVCNDLNITDCYVGHTTNFNQRKYTHKSHCNNENDEKYYLLVYQTIRNNGGWNNWSMIQIEEYSCNDLQVALARERYWIETLKATLNKIIPTRTKKEYYNQNKEQIKEYKKEYYNQNKEQINTYQKQKNTCQCGGHFTINHRAEHYKTKLHQDYLANLKEEVTNNI